MRPPSHRALLCGGFLTAAFGVLALARAASSAPSSPASPAAEGRKVFLAKPCGGCHAIGGQGGSVGPKLDNIGARHDAAWLRKKIITPKFNAPSTIMPAVDLKPAELNALMAYLASLKPAPSSPPPSKPAQPAPSHPTPASLTPAPPSPSGTPPSGSTGGQAPLTEAQARGKAIYDAKGCQGCHALGGQGGAVGPALDDVGSRRDAAYLRAQIANPKAHNPNSVMPAYDLPPADMDALVAFLSSRRAGAPSAPPTPAQPPSGPPQFVGSAVCMTCHADLSKQFARTVHANALLEAHDPQSPTGCETCHGPGSHHAATGDPKLIVQPAKLTPRRNSELCLRCHTGEVTHHDWLTSAHSQAGVSCSACHQVMQQVVTKLLRRPANELCVSCHRKEAAQFAGVSHHPVPEGRMQCIDCHNPHSGVNDGMLRLPGNQMCLSCHADKQGPFVFEHPAVNGGFTEGCLSCHLPHGSPFKDLRKIAGRGLCIQCHTDKAVNHFDTYPDCTTSGCHVQIHGSHEDQLFLR